MMARYNEILVGRFPKAVQKLFGMKGEVPVASVAGEMMVVHEITNGIENRFIESWDRFAATVGPTGGAAQSAAFVLRNPAGSNVLAVVEQIFVWSPQALNVSIQRNVVADLTTVAGGTNVLPDKRGRPNSALIPSFTTNGATTGQTLFSISALVNVTFAVISTQNQEIPITPGDGVQLLDNTQAAQMNVSVLWRERYLEESERA